MTTKKSTQPRNSDGTFAAEAVRGKRLTYDELDAMACVLAERVYARGSPGRLVVRESNRTLTDLVRSYGTLMNAICTLRKAATDEELGPRIEALEEAERRRSGTGRW